MRLIDADMLDFTIPENPHPLTAALVQIVKDDVERCPTIDAEVVVRCKDCKHGVAYNRMDGKTGYYCHQPNAIFRYGALEERKFTPVREENDFCSYGERKDGVEDG